MSFLRAVEPRGHLSKPPSPLVFANYYLYPFNIANKPMVVLNVHPQYLIPSYDPNHSDNTWANFREFYKNPQEFSKLLPSFSFSNFENFRGLPSPILEPRRCPHSRKLSKFENENENSRGLRVSLTALSHNH